MYCAKGGKSSDWLTAPYRILPIGYRKNFFPSGPEFIRLDLEKNIFFTAPSGAVSGKTFDWSSRRTGRDRVFDCQSTYISSSVRSFDGPDPTLKIYFKVLKP